MSRQSSPPTADVRSSLPGSSLHAPDYLDGCSSPCNGKRASAGATTSSAVDDHINRNSTSNNNNASDGVARRERPSRACTARSAARLYAAAAAEAAPAERKLKISKRERYDEGLQPHEQQCSSSKPPTLLVSSPPPSQLPRWNLRSMWELASIFNFLHIFRPLLNISVEFSAEEFETALLTPPNDTLSDLHIPLLKAIPPVTRMALGRNTWVTVLCRKLRDWWYWVAEGEIPIIASHGAEADLYNTLDPATRVLILKALCDIRVEQEDIRNYIDDSIKHGVQLSAFRKERIGGDSHGMFYWYEDDPIIGHRLYREFRKAEAKREKKKKVNAFLTTYTWETVATNLDEFQDVSEKLLESKNRTEVSLGKKVKIDMLPEVEKIHKRKEKLLKKQHRQALLLDNFYGVDGLAPGRSLRDRKPVTYTFDDFDRSINEAIKITKRKPPSPEPSVRREEAVKPEVSTNGDWNSSPSNNFQNATFSTPSPNFDYDDIDAEEKHGENDLDRSMRRRQRPQRYSAREFVEAVSDNEADFDSDDDIVGEAVYDEEYLKRRKQRRKVSSSSEGEGDEEYRGDEDHAEEEDLVSGSEDSDDTRRLKKLPSRARRELKLRSVDDLQAGLRRSRRATRHSIDYRQYAGSESESDESNASDGSSGGSQASNGSDGERDVKIEDRAETVPEKPGPEGARKTRFLDLNQLAPGSGFDDCPNPTAKEEDGGGHDDGDGDAKNF